MPSVTSSLVNIEISAESVPSVPAWFGEVTLIARHLEQQGVLSVALTAPDKAPFIVPNFQ